jgi:hypothetical protein
MRYVRFASKRDVRTPATITPAPAIRRTTAIRGVARILRRFDRTLVLVRRLGTGLVLNELAVVAMQLVSRIIERS